MFYFAMQWISTPYTPYPSNSSMFFKQIPEDVYSVAFKLLHYYLFALFCSLLFFTFIFFPCFLFLCFLPFFGGEGGEGPSVLLWFCGFQGYLSGRKTNTGLFSFKEDFGWGNNTFVVNSKWPSVYCWKNIHKVNISLKYIEKDKEKPPRVPLSRLLFKAFGLFQLTWLWTELLRMSGLKPPTVLLDWQPILPFLQLLVCRQAYRLTFYHMCSDFRILRGPWICRGPPDLSYSLLPLNKREILSEWPPHELCILIICKTCLLIVLGDETF